MRKAYRARFGSWLWDAFWSVVSPGVKAFVAVDISPLPRLWWRRPEGEISKAPPASTPGSATRFGRG